MTTHTPSAAPHGQARRRAPFWRWAKAISWACIAIALVGLVICIADYGEGEFRNQAVGRFGADLITAVFVPIFFWFIVLIVGLLRGFHQNLKTATTPIPSLQEIDRQLRLEGYQPSLQDLLAVEAHLRAQRNEAALAAGVIFLGLHEAARTSRGK